MIKLDEIDYLIKLCIFSAYINKEKPVSAILLAPPEHGKSELLKKYNTTNGVKISSDFNTCIFEDIVTEIETGKIKTLVLPDFLRITNKSHSAQQNALMILNALTEEGWTGYLPFGRKVEKPIFLNVITALTESELKDKRHKWAKIGFLSRFLPISYSYNSITKEMIRTYIRARLYNEDTYSSLKLPENKIDVALPDDISKKIEKITLNISEQNNILGFRLQRQLQVLAMANALCCSRSITTDEDVSVIKNLSKFINFNFSEV